MKTKTVLATASMLPLSLLSLSAQQQDQMRPNVIWIMADDLGIGDLGCFGQKDIRTPNIDALARAGMIFENQYTGSAVSAPSRCSLMTGKHTGHTTVRGNIGWVDSALDEMFDTPLKANPEDITVAQIFKQAGYSTGCAGKWGLGGPNDVSCPNRKGFDYFFGFLGQKSAHKYYPHHLWENNDRVVLDYKVYSHDLITDKALAWIDEHADEPFFFYFVPTLPHAELHIPPGAENDYAGMFEETPYVNEKATKDEGFYSTDVPRQSYASMVTRLDREVGRIVALLKEKGVYENTIVVFTSDNGVHVAGGHDCEYFNSNWFYRGHKFDLYEGGVHTPFILSWPAVVAPGSRTLHVTAFWDFMPTVCELLGVKTPKESDGISYLPTITGNGVQKEHDFLFYELCDGSGKRSVISDGWKLVQIDVRKSKKMHYELYNLYLDPDESCDVLEQNPKIFAKLKKIMDKAEVPARNFEMTPIPDK